MANAQPRKQEQPKEAPLPVLLTCPDCWGSGVRYKGRFKKRVIYVCELCAGLGNFYETKGQP